MDVNLTSAPITATNCFSEALKTVIKVCFWVRIRHLNFLKDLSYPFFTIPRGIVLQFFSYNNETKAKSSTCRIVVLLVLYYQY